MKITIAKTDTIADVQEKFNKRYEFLRLDFFNEPHAIDQPSELRSRIDPNTKIETISKGGNGQHTIEFFPATSVAELESAFFDAFGISAQVYRKAGDVWLQTTTTDSWTLKEQNERAHELG